MSLFNQRVSLINSQGFIFKPRMTFGHSKKEKSMEKKKIESKNQFNKQAKDYDYAQYGHHARKIYPYILSEIMVSSASTILDLGCGTGELLKLISEQNEDSQLFGVDISKRMLEIAHQKLKDKAYLLYGDAEYLLFEKEKFDLVYCNDSFHHYPNPQKVLKEVARVLKKGGIFVLGDCYQPLISRWMMNLYMKFSHTGDVRIYSKKQIEKLLFNDFELMNWKVIQDKTAFCCVAVRV